MGAPVGHTAEESHAQRSETVSVQRAGGSILKLIANYSNTYVRKQRSCSSTKAKWTSAR